MSASPRAPMHAADTGFIAEKPAPQLASSGSPAHQPINAAAAIATAAKPAASLARCLFRLVAGPTNSVTSAPGNQNRSQRVLADIDDPVWRALNICFRGK